MKMGNYILLILVCPVFLLINACNSKKSISNVISRSDFIFDTSYPRLTSGMYMISDSDTATVKQLYSYSKDDKNYDPQKYGLETKDFVSFENLDSIYSEKSGTGYEDFYDITLRFNPTGRTQLYNLTKKCKDFTEAEKYDGLLIGMVINNTLVQISHILNPIDSNSISLSGGTFNKKTVNDIMLYLEEDRIKK